MSVSRGLGVVGTGGRRGPGGDSGTDRLIDIYDRYFDCVWADTQGLRTLAHRVRYQVYCIEHQYEDPAEHPGGLEQDEFDNRALHSLLIHRPTEIVAGAVRLILPDPDEGGADLPIRRICPHPWLNADSYILPRVRTAEISRFAIAKKFRRRLGDRVPAVGGEDPDSSPRRMIPHISLGLMRSIVAMTAQSGMTHLCAVMEPALLRLLRRLGIHFNDMGPRVDYHGLRQPCFTDLDVLLARTWIERRDVWEVLTCDGTIWPVNERLTRALAPVN